MSPDKGTDSNSGTQGQVATSAQISCTADSPHQASAVDSSTVGWHQVSRPWEGRQKSAGGNSGIRAPEDLDPCEISTYPLSLFLKSLEKQAFHNVPSQCRLDQSILRIPTWGFAGHDSVNE